MGGGLGESSLLLKQNRVEDLLTLTVEHLGMGHLA